MIVIINYLLNSIQQDRSADQSNETPSDETRTRHPTPYLSCNSKLKAVSLSVLLLHLPTLTLFHDATGCTELRFRHDGCVGKAATYET